MIFETNVANSATKEMGEMPLKKSGDDDETRQGGAKTSRDSELNAEVQVVHLLIRRAAGTPGA